MCGGGGGGDGGASAAAAEEAQRRAAIKQGTDEIDRIFGGYKRGTGSATTPAAGGAYYLADGTPVTYNKVDLDPQPVYSQPQRRLDSTGNFWITEVPAQLTGYTPSSRQYLSGNGKEQDYTGQSLYSGVETVPGFDDNFYSGLETRYKDNAMPQLNQDAEEARRQLAYQLARKGILSSTAAAHEQGKLEDRINKYRLDVDSNAKSYSQKVRGDIENSRTNLVSQLALTEDPAAAAAGAMRIADSYSEPPAFDPIGQFVFTLSEGLQRESANRGYEPMFGPSLFSSGGKGNSSISYRN